MKQTSKLDQAMLWFASVLRSNTFFALLIALFVVQAVYLAFVGLYSMAFDEYYHFGMIQAYSHVWLPWFVQQPPGPVELGAVTTDTSYLFHYLMSFPYRLIALITDSQMAQIIALRLVDVGIVVVGLYVYRRLLLLLGLPRAVTHFILAVFMLLPVTPWLAGQLSYDTLFFTLSGLSLLVSVRLAQSIARDHRLPLAQVALTLGVLAFAAQVKYAFLPLAFAVGAYLLGLIIVEVRAGRLRWRQELAGWRTAMSTGPALMAVGLLLLGGVFFIQRYGANMAQYGTLIPDCGVVLTEKACSDYDPYGRNQRYIDAGYPNDITTENLLKYPTNWFIQMMRETYFAVGPREIGYQTGLPLPISYVTGYVIALSSMVILVLGLPRLLRRGPATQLLLLAVVLYIGALFWQNFGDYRETGVPVAIHGRYIIQLLPVIGALVYLAAPSALRLIRANHRIVLATAAAALLLTFYGGGATPFIIRSNDAWYWPYAVPTSNVVRDMLSPVIFK